MKTKPLKVKFHTRYVKNLQNPQNFLLKPSAKQYFI